MKTKILLFGISFMLFFSCFTNLNAQQVKSYMQLETVGQSVYGPIQQPAPGRMATTVTWNSDGSVQLMDGTRWTSNGTMWDGTFCFKYAGTTGIVMPNTQYQELRIAADYSMIQVNFVFGMPGMYQQMYTRYSYFGEGTQPAFDYINGGSYNGGGWGF